MANNIKQFIKLFACQRAGRQTINNQFLRNNLHTSQTLLGAPHGEDPIKNFMDFKYPNKVGTFEHYRLPKHLLEEEFNYPVYRDTMGTRWPGYWFQKKFVYVQEMEPELVVPDLEGFELKPYVSYRAEEVQTEPFTAKELFESVYEDSIIEDFENNKLDEYNVSPEEIDDARLKALQTGADLFEDRTLEGVRAPIEYVV